MSQPDRRLPSFRMVARGLLFLARMWASERRFRRHARARQHHQVATARHLDGMTAELKYRVALCEQFARSAPRYQQPRAANGIPIVVLHDFGEEERL